MTFQIPPPMRARVPKITCSRPSDMPKQKSDFHKGGQPKVVGEARRNVPRNINQAAAMPARRLQVRQLRLQAPHTQRQARFRQALCPQWLQVRAKTDPTRRKARTAPPASPQRAAVVPGDKPSMLRPPDIVVF